MQAINSSVKSEDDVIERFEDSIFTGEYVTGHVDDAYLKSVASVRSNSAKIKKSITDASSQQNIAITVED